MTQIRYVGKKEVKPDNVAGTGLVWAGNGDVQDVESPVAVAKLLRHPDVWELADGEAPPASDPETPKTDQDEEDEAEFNTKPNLAYMDKAAMVEFAKNHYQLTFPPRTGEAKIRAAIIERMNRG